MNTPDMRVIFDITHPADVHLFKNAIRAIESSGGRCLVATRDKDVTLRLLDELNIEHVCLSRMGRGLVGMGRELLARHAKMYQLARRFRPDVMVARMGISIGPTGWLLGVPRVVIEDSEHAKLQLLLSLPFATTILTGFGYLKDYGRKQVRFPSLPVLAYLHPAVFTPDSAALRKHGVNPDEPFILLRIVSWQAVHDIGYTGASDSELPTIVQRLSKFGRVLVSSERPLPPEMKQYESPVPAAHLHDLLAFARLCIGEGGTIAAEAAVLGTPAIFTSPLRTGYLLELERRWGLLRNVNTLREGLAIAEEWLDRPGLRKEWAVNRKQLLADCEDASACLVRHIRAGAEARRGGRRG